MRRVANKWAKHNVLRRHSGMAVHLPDTRIYSSANLRIMIDRYRYVVVKPVFGSGGAGVIKVEKTGDGTYRYHYFRSQRKLSSLDQVRRMIDHVRVHRKYIIQRGIRLATVSGRPVDYRVKLQKRKSGWHIRAIVARIAKPGQFITNLCRGGLMRGSLATLRHSFSNKDAALKKATMIGVAHTGTKLLEKRYPGLGMLGFDFGVDQRGHIWIFEVNTNPH